MFARLGRSLLPLLLMGTVLCVADDKKPTPRDKPKPDDAKVEFQVLAIRATTRNKDISPELREIADALKKQFKFTGYKLEKRSNGSAELKSTYKAPLVGTYEARLTPQKVEDKRVTIEIEIYSGEERKLKTTATLDAGKSQLLGGYKLDGGDELIVAVSSR